MLENPAFVSVLVGSILSPLVFFCRHFSAADCKLISCRAAWLGVLVLDFFRSHPTQFESSLKEKAASHRPFFCCPDRAFEGNPHHGNSTIPNVKCVHPSPSTPTHLPKPNHQTFHPPTPEIHHSSPLRLGNLHQAQAQGIGHPQKALITWR